MSNEAPKEIPPQFIAGFTMNGLVKREDWYINETEASCGSKIYTKEAINELVQKANRREMNYYGETDIFLYEALKNYPIEGKSCVVMGSQIPWYEAICLSFQAAHITTIEYWQTVSEHPLVKLVTPSEYEKNPERFDVGLSISSFEHDGLGRYGDPINPEADLQTMKRMKSIIKPGGILFLAVPVAVDKIVWNAHRIYGHHRLPLLLAGWKVLAGYGISEQLLNIDTGVHGKFQPVLVLENTV